MNDAERMKERVRDLLRSLAAFSDREGRRILLLVPLLVALSLLFLWLGKPKFERSFALWADAAADSARRARCEEFRKADAAGGRSRASSASDSLFRVRSQYGPRGRVDPSGLHVPSGGGHTALPGGGRRFSPGRGLLALLYRFRRDVPAAGTLCRNRRAVPR